MYTDGAGSTFVKWCGLLINTSNLELQADYTRYAGLPLSSTLTVPLSKVLSSWPPCVCVPSLYTCSTSQCPTVLHWPSHPRQCAYLTILSKVPARPQMLTFMVHVSNPTVPHSTPQYPTVRHSTPQYLSVPHSTPRYLSVPPQCLTAPHSTP